MNNFFKKQEDNFQAVDADFGYMFLSSLFKDKYQRKYSLTGDGMYHLIFLDNKIYDLKLKEVKALLPNDGKKAFRDSGKDEIIDIISKEYENNNIEYTINSGKFICAIFHNRKLKIEVTKKVKIPE